jgi:NACHT domain
MLINIDEVATGALVNALAVAGRRLATSATSRRGRDDLEFARWSQTFQLTDHVPDLTPALTAQTPEILRGDEIQAALQELLAIRLTDAPEADVARARAVFELTLPGPELAQALFDYYDDQIGGIVARLEAADSPALDQIRRDAFSARMVAILGAIERHTAALTARPDPGAEARFLASYRRHVIDVHGKLSPPDFDRRRRIPISDIYVPTQIFHAEQALASRPVHVAELQQADGHVLDLPGLLDRTVLLGDPGGGKTTAANVLMHHLASVTGHVPFLVTLREYATQDPPERSVTEYIEHTLATLYQCPAPPGLVELLLLTGSATVIFDGLDELLDASRRVDVATRVEQFCTEYPLAPVLVTSRLIGYDQARLDDSQFSCFRLGGFGEEQVRDYAGKWFALDEGARPRGRRGVRRGKRKHRRPARQSADARPAVHLVPGRGFAAPRPRRGV